MSSRAIAKVSLALLIVAIIVVAGIGVGLYYSMQPTTPSTSTTTAASTAAGLHDTLTIDETFWSGYDLNPIPAVINIVGSEWWLETVYQSLITMNASSVYATGDTSQVLPMLATDWSVSPDGLTYTFNLRQNVTFSNGDPFNAYQVWGNWYALYYLTGNSTSFMNGYQVFDMSKVQFGPATLALMATSGVINPTPDLLKIMSDNTWPIYAPSPYQLVLHLKNPFTWMPQVLTTFNGLVFDTQYVLQNGGWGAPGAPNTYFNQHSIPGTGPYMITAFEIGSYEKFEQNPNYWGRNLTPAEIQANPYLDPGHVKTVFVYGKTDDLARYTDLSTGTAQIASIYQQNWPLILANPDKYGYFAMPDSTLINIGIGMNTLRYPTNITAFREAVVHAVNVTDINQKIYFGTMTPLVGPEYKAAGQYYDLGNFPPYSYNMTLAQQYLAQSGVDVSKLTPLEFRTISGCTSCIGAAQVVQADLAALNIPMTVEVTPPAQMAVPYTSGYTTYANSIQFAQQEAQFTWMGFPTFAPTSPTPADAWITFVSLKSPTGNFANYGNSIVESCVNAWFTTTDTTAIKATCTTANTQIYNDVPYIWLGSPKLAFGAGSVAFDKNVVKSFYMDPCFTGEGTTAIFNTVTFVS